MESVEGEQGIHFAWDKSVGVTREAAAFAGRVIGSDIRYISHGEIQTGLSVDAAHWAPDLARLYAEDFADLGDGRDLLVARDGDGRLLGIAVVAWEETPRRRFAVLEDMAVDPDQRSHGLGAGMLEQVEMKVRARGISWLFLESGLNNHGAHRFFERHGFDMISHVFAKAL